MPRPLKVLIAEDNPADAELVVRQVRRAGFEPEWSRVDTEADYLASLHAGLDIILSDYEMPQFSGIRALELLRESGLDIPLILISGTIGEDTAVAAMKQGAVDYLLKDRLTRLGPAMSHALEQSKLRRERKEAELELRESEERFREVVENIEEVFWMTNVEKNEMLFISAAYEKIWGRTCASLYGSPITWAEAIHPEDRDRVLRSANTKQLEGTYHEEYRIVRPDGSIRWINDRAFPIRDASGAVLRVAGVARDITERKQAEQALQLFRALVDQSAATFEVIDPATGRFLDVNEKGPAELGCTREEYLALRVFDIDPIVTESTWPQLAEKIRTTSFVTGEGSHRRKDGTTFPIEFNAKWVRLDRDYIVTVVRDVTERKRAEEVLRNPSRRKVGMAKELAVIFGIGALIYGYLFFVDPFQAPAKAAALKYLDSVDDVIEVQGLVLLGLVVFLYRRWKEFRDQAGQQRHVREALQTLHGELETRVQERTVELSKSNEALRAEIAEREHANERIREQAQMLDEAHEAIIVRDFQTRRITFWNRGAERLYGWTAAEVVGRDMGTQIYVDPSARDAVIEQLLQAGTWHGEHQHLSKSGRKLIVSSNSTLVRDAGGNPKSVLLINIDITEQKNLEAQFLRAQRMESIGTLASGLAHDLNNILSPIMMSAAVLRHEMSAEQREEMITMIESSADRGAQIVKQVLTFGRGLEAEKLPLEMGLLVKEMTKIMRQTFPKDIVIESALAPGLWPVNADPTQMHQVLLNLCVNARDAMPNGGKLRLRTSNLDLDSTYASTVAEATAGPHVLLEVSDTGTGIPPEVVERMFEPFFTTKGIGKGTGLGLSTVHGIIKNHGGFITVTSQPGEGTTFRVHLPASPEPVGTGASAAAPGKLPKGHGELVLVVDDEEGMRRAARTILETFGYEVLLATDGAEGLGVFAQNSSRVAVVVVDLMMPIMNGTVLIRALRKIAPNVPVIASTGLQERTQSPELKELGIHSILHKPYRAETLLRTVHAALHPESAA